MVSIASQIVDIECALRGQDEVITGFGEISAAASTMGTQVEESSTRMDVGFRRLSFTSASLIMHSIQLTDIFDRMAKGQMDVARGAIMVGIIILELAAKVMVLVGAEQARIVAHSIANALSGPLGWAALAAGAAAVGIGLSLAAQVPSAPVLVRHAGGEIYQTGNYGLLAGEYILRQGEHEKLHNTVNNQTDRRSTNVTFYIYGNEPQRTADEVADRMRRAGYL